MEAITDFFTVGTIGGILLVIGAFFVYQGKIFQSIFAYLFADIIWIILAYQSGDIQGTVMIIIGATLGFGAFLKMNYGKMRKTLDL